MEIVRLLLVVPSNSYRNFVLAMLTLVYVFNFIDRQLLVILQESIKEELHLSDTQLGMLSGFTFAIFYVTMGIPIARWADRGEPQEHRGDVARVMEHHDRCVGIGAQLRSLTDGTHRCWGWRSGWKSAGTCNDLRLFFRLRNAPRRCRSIRPEFTSGCSSGFLMGGYLNEELGWRTAFVVLGIPGILLSLLFYATVKEPQRGATDVNTSANADYSFIQVVKLLFSKPTFAFLSAATALHVFCIYGMLNWTPSFLSRLHGMNKTDIGVALGLILGITGATGTFVGGLLTDRFGKTSKQSYLKIPAIFILASIPFVAGALFLHDRVLSLFCFGVVNFLYSTYLRSFDQRCSHACTGIVACAHVGDPVSCS